MRRRGSVTSGAMLGRRSWKGVLAARLSELLGQRQQRLPFRPGRRPRMLVRRPWSASVLPGAAWAVGGRVVRRRGSHVGGGMSGRRPQVFLHHRGRSFLCRVGDKFARGDVRGGGSWRWPLSSTSEHPVPAPLIAVVDSSLDKGGLLADRPWSGCGVGFARLFVIWFSPGFFH